MLQIRVTDKKVPEALVVAVADDPNRPEVLSELAHRAGIDAANLQQDFSADWKEMTVLYDGGGSARRLYLVGLGKKTDFLPVQNAFRLFCHRYKSKLPAKIGVDLRRWPAHQVAFMAEAIANGILLGCYDLGLYRQKDDKARQQEFGREKSSLEMLVATEHIADTRAAVAKAEAIAEAQLCVFHLMNSAGNYKSPASLATTAAQKVHPLGINLSVMDKAALEKAGLHALMAVGQGSPQPPVLITLEYHPGTRKEAVPCIGLVGKGITFDTGGISIKPSANMHYMKSDLGGAAAVLGTFMAVARLQLPVRLVGILPAAENMIDGLALKPGDVIQSYAGKTIEVTDTDAEGRLILADGLSWLVRHYPCDAVIDLATLTGSIIRAIGTHAAGLFAQNDALALQLTQAGTRCGERLWRMPLWEEYGTDLKSDVADLRNFTGKPMAESISAAKFLEHFTDAHPAWAHIDIAGMAFGDSDFSSSKSATGYGVRLLTEYISDLCRSAGSTS